MEIRPEESGMRCPVQRRQLLLAGSAAFCVATSIPASSRIASHPLGRYQVRVLAIDPPRFQITADLPVDGDNLAMSDSHPAELPQMAEGGWPSLVSNLAVNEPNGRPVELARLKSGGWRLTRPLSGRLHLSYVVDFAIFAKAGWPSPLESAIADDEHGAVSARALFITTEKMTGAVVRFVPLDGWRTVAPWPRSSSSRGAFRATTKLDLTDNFIVFSRRQPDVITAAGFTMQITAMGHWKPLRPLVRQVLQSIMSYQVAMMDHKGRETYNVVLVPVQDTGGGAYRQSFVYAFKGPSVANRNAWANTMAHEIFHYWNSARLQGGDYASTQWFQEGFTEYVANLTVVSGGIVDPSAFLEKLGAHVDNYRRLTTTREAIGTRKGPPLYSAGAIVAFAFDGMIRNATDGRRDIGAFFRNLWRYTNAGECKYAWPDIEASLRGTANLDWQGFYERHIRGNEALPLEKIFHQAGLRLTQGQDGSARVALDERAAPARKAIWEGILG